jgi:hypothetical protein
MERGRNWKWHKWFAWYPVKIDRARYAWLVYVERKYTWVVSPSNPEDAKIVWKYQKL